MGLICSSDDPRSDPAAILTKEEADDIIGDVLRKKYEKAGQEQVFKYADSGKLSKSGVEQLKKQLESLELDRIAKVFKGAMEHDQKGQEELGALTPFPTSDTDSITEDSFDMEKFERLGLEAIAKGEVAALVLAGGAGTRLGFPSPKGLFSIGLPSGKSLFQLFAERLKKASVLAGSDKLIPWYVMTSEGKNHEETEKYFKDQEYFGYVNEAKEPQIYFFSQGVLPCLTNDGKIMLETGCKVGVAADGNGGIYKALQSTGKVADMKNRGVKYVHCFSVDNAISKVGDATFMGYCIEKEGCDLGNKVVWKAEPGEKVGVVGMRDGRPAVIEYTEISKEATEEVDENGKLKYGAGNVCNHFYTLDFLEKVEDNDLIFHVAKKKIKTPKEDAPNESQTPAEINGVKMEAFIFDCFNKASNMAVLEGPRDTEFSPVKNPKGNPKDSPDSARKMLTAQSKMWLQKAGATLENADGEGQIEIGPFVSYRGEGLEGFNGLNVDCSKDIKIDVLEATKDPITKETAQELLNATLTVGTLAAGNPDTISSTQ